MKVKGFMPLPGPFVITASERPRRSAKLSDHKGSLCGKCGALIMTMMFCAFGPFKTIKAMVVTAYILVVSTIIGIAVYIALAFMM